MGLGGPWARPAGHLDFDVDVEFQLQSKIQTKLRLLAPAANKIYTIRIELGSVLVMHPTRPRFSPPPPPTPPARFSPPPPPTPPGRYSPPPPPTPSGRFSPPPPPTPSSRFSPPPPPTPPGSSRQHRTILPPVSATGGVELDYENPVVLICWKK
ncbi:hypothetical protein R3P38DRAFT_141568 [Favolaschia claudopus]|uniref:Uncharacterized protein n=1 Tax=Favolaschia claudopus TaxID=2862362 RepID=A0AAV9ZVC5_9AGAR